MSNKNKSKWSRKQVLISARLFSRTNGFTGDTEYVVILEYYDGATSSTHFDVKRHAEKFRAWAVKNAR